MMLVAMFAVVSLVGSPRLAFPVFCVLLLGMLKVEWQEVEWQAWQRQHGFWPM